MKKSCNWSKTWRMHESGSSEHFTVIEDLVSWTNEFFFCLFLFSVSIPTNCKLISHTKCFVYFFLADLVGPHLWWCSVALDARKSGAGCHWKLFPLKTHVIVGVILISSPKTTAVGNFLNPTNCIGYDYWRQLRHFVWKYRWNDYEVHDYVLCTLIILFG